MSRIVLATFGSLGDLHPFLALGRELAARGHRVTLATHARYRGRAEAEGLAFHPVRPDHDDFGPVDEVMPRAIDARRGSEFVARRLALPWVRASGEDLIAACRAAGADALVGHTLTFAAPLVAEALGIAYVQTALQPFVLYSAWDPPALEVRRGTRWPPRLTPVVWRGLRALARPWTRPWFRELDVLRAAMGLPPSRAHPIFDGWSPMLNLALFSAVLAAPQPDWPPHTVVTGFLVHDRDGETPADAAELERALAIGDAPLVFTLGSAAVWDPGSFYEAAARAAARLGRRAVLLTGPDGRNVPAELPPGVVAAGYVPHSGLFPRAAAIVHQGGIGTTGQALRAGRPMLIVPFSHDQPDNADRCRRLGVARVLGRSEVTAEALARELEALLADRELEARARAIGARVRAERGAAAAADALEERLAARPRPHP